MSNLRSQYLPIAFQLSNGSCKIRYRSLILLLVWKSRNLTYTGKTLIVKNLLISLCGYEIEMRGIPEIYVKEITTLVWRFIWGGGINQIDPEAFSYIVKISKDFLTDSSFLLNS
jgi:hypothetical protein